MEVNEAGEIPKWVEQDLIKMSCKELKKLARLSNVNPNLRKADLVTSLLAIGQHISEKCDETIEARTDNSRMTRSRVSTFQRPNDTVDIDFQISVSQLSKKDNERENETTTHIVNENKTKTKRRGRKVSLNKHESNYSKSDSEILEIGSSIDFDAKPLQEITNKDELLNPKISRAKRKMIMVSSEGTETALPDIVSHNELNVKGEELMSKSLIGENIGKKGKEKTIKRRGRRKKSQEICEVIQDNFLQHEHEHERENEELTRGKVSTLVNFESICKLENENANQEVESEGGKYGNELKKSQRKGRGKKGGKEIIQFGNVGNSDALLLNTNTSGSQEDECEIGIATSVNSEMNTNKSNTIGDNDKSLAIQSHDDFTFHISNEEKSSTASIEGTDSDLEKMPGLVRSSTFTLEEENSLPDKRSSSGSKMSSMPARSNTFTFNDDDKSCRRSSLRFTAAEKEKSTVSDCPPKIEKSIGKRILAVTVKQRGRKLPGKEGTGSSVKKTIMKASATPGSSVKKTIMKATATPGSAVGTKFGRARKLPDFKTIHQKLFNNMESIEENKKRNNERAQALLLSPVVPTCAKAVVRSETKKEPHYSAKRVVPTRVHTPNNPTSRKTITPRKESTPDNASTIRKVLPRRVQTPNTLPSSKTTKPTRVQTPNLSSPSTSKPKTFINSQRPITGTVVNRFGFKNRINKKEASNIIGHKMPPATNTEKKKEEIRSLIQGVRMNKRFMLQMQMRQGH